MPRVQSYRGISVLQRELQHADGPAPAWERRDTGRRSLGFFSGYTQQYERSHCFLEPSKPPNPCKHQLVNKDGPDKAGQHPVRASIWVVPFPKRQVDPCLERCLLGSRWTLQGCSRLFSRIPHPPWQSRIIGFWWGAAPGQGRPVQGVPHAATLQCFANLLACCHVTGDCHALPHQTTTPLSPT